MEKLEKKLPKEAKTVWMINGIITFAILLLIPIGYFTMRFFIENLPLWPLYVSLAFAIIIGILTVFITPNLKMIYWGYAIREDEVDIQYGIIIVKRTLIPMTRIQHVDTEHGPIQRKFKLATLSISTAGSNHKIPALQEETANQLRKDISHLANTSDENV